MPGVLRTLGDDGQTPAQWAMFAGQINAVARLAAGVATNPSAQKLDQYGNCTFIVGPLNQVVTIGAAFQQVGVQVGTALTGFGSASPTAFVHTTITVTAGLTAATVASAVGLVNGMVIGAILPVVVGEPAVQAITPGTTFTISGLSVTLSQAAVQSGTNLYCCAATWTPSSVTVHP